MKEHVHVYRFETYTQGLLGIGYKYKCLYCNINSYLYPIPWYFRVLYL